MKLSFSSAVVGLLLVAYLHAGEPAGYGDYHGRWELVIANVENSFRSVFLRLGEEEGKLEGELVWRFGGVRRLDEKSVSLGENGELLIQRRDWKVPLTLRRVGDALQGHVEQRNGKRYLVVGRRGLVDVDVRGEWDVVIELADRDARGRLRFRDQGLGRVTAEGVSEQGERVEVERLRIDGNRVSLVFVTGDGRELTLSAEIRGDRLKGHIDPGDGSQAVPIRGTRQRRWGKPVHLLAESGLRGWRPRHQSEKFGWTCENGVLTNGKGDVDIASDAEFDDFRLELEYRIVKGGNSGIYLRGRYEVQILDHHGEPANNTNGSVYGRLAPSQNATGEAMTWQKYEITLIGRYLTVVLNGKTVIDNQELAGPTGGALWPYESRPGPVLLQGDHGKVYFRNIVVTPALPPELRQ